MASAKGTKTLRLPRSERRRQLLVAAREVFVSRGYHGSSMDDIADAAHVSKPVLYQHFPGKRELYLALLQEHLSDLAERLSGALDSTEDNRERVHATMAEYFGFADENSEAHRMVFQSDLTADPDVQKLLNDFHTEFAAAIAAVIATDTHLGTQESMLLGRGLSAMVEAGTLQWLRSGRELDMQEAIGLIHRLAWRGISRFPKES